MTWSPGFTDFTPGPTSTTTPPLMAEDRGEQPFGIRARQGEFVGMADAGGADLHHHLAFAGALELYLHDLERAGGLQGHGGAGAHG
ncbi:hypothetical protein ruthe_01960 [Rubellimicrobium thermophilum DSM 16684]|uniref:Uncharacterized protein n=1 Tax=Rubellimicrobium thermophilum DSM 16684 TaxID=1123069 RepID=S9QTF6_9RHOB|nr:hypothetical protein ruthe_01960 [Rubellimicrobium thermophilum DSM 16684]